MRKASILFLIFLSSAVWAQNQPHVTNISIEMRNNLIRLTWEDSPAARGNVYIFRSARPFTSSIPANIRPVVVSYGTQYYIDDTDDLENLFYFIAASDTMGRRYDTIFPQVNSIYVNLVPRHDVPAADVPAPVIALPPVYAHIDGLSDLRAVLDGEKVKITFNNPEPQRNAILYRSTQPVTSSHDLLNAFIVRPAYDSQYIDYPVPGAAWYYAVIYEDEISKGNITINPGINTTSNAVIIASEQTSARSMRSIPLPELSLSNVSGGFLSGQIIHTPLGEDTAFMLSNIPLPQRGHMELKRPRVFLIDLQAPLGGEESALFQIIKEHFELFDWENSSVRLRHFLSLPRSKEVEARARFYLGQSLYFTGNYREALMEFLAFRAYHQVEANIWIDAVLTAMVN